MKTYIIVRSANYNPDLFEEIINIKIKKGCTLIGGVSSDGNNLLQAMIKDKTQVLDRTLYAAGTPIPSDWYTLTYNEGYSKADYPSMKFQFIKDTYITEIAGKRYAQPVRPLTRAEMKSNDRTRFDVIGITGIVEARLDFPCTMLKYEHDLLAIVWKELDKPNKVFIAIRRVITDIRRS